MAPISRQSKAALVLGIAFAGALIAQPASAQSSTINVIQSGMSSLVQTSLKTGMSISDFITAEQALIPSSKVEEYACDIDNFVIGRVIGTPLTPGPFNAACGAHANGAGYYVVGDTAPGGIVPFNRIGAYLPTKDLGCSARQYHFNIKVAGQTKLFALGHQADDYFNNWVTTKVFPSAMATDVVNMQKSLVNLYGGVGNFAVMAAINPYTHSATMYMMAENPVALNALAVADSNARRTNGTYSSVMKYSNMIVDALLTHGTAGVVRNSVVLRGSSIDDQFSGTCYSPIFFWYIAGTANVVLN